MGRGYADGWKHNTMRTQKRNAIGMPIGPSIRGLNANKPKLADPRAPKFPAKDLSTKGELHGLCNRSACLEPGARWFNTSTRKYYCKSCAWDISKFAKRAEGYHICFYTTGDAAEDAKMKFGEEYERSTDA